MYHAVLLLVGLLALTTPGAKAKAQEQAFDLLIVGGRVLDGSGNPWVRQDVGVRGDKIVALGRLDGMSARHVIDATGMYVAPGFIDLHSHAPPALAADDMIARRAESHIAQGLTTVVGAADGRSLTWPLAKEVAAYEEAGIGMNVVLMAGHNTIRAVALGDDYQRVATLAEIEKMKSMLVEAMEAGAFGLFGGLEYDPGRFSSREEVLALAEVLAEHDGFYIAHQRSEASMPLWQLPSIVDGWPVDGLQGLQETIEIARRTGIRVVASHHKARGRASFGRSNHDLEVIDRAREEEGLQVYLDVYPYETFGGGPRPMLPNWAFVYPAAPGTDVPGELPPQVATRRASLERNWAASGTRELIARDVDWRVDHNGGEGRVIVVAHLDETLVGRTLEELARERQVSVSEFVVLTALQGDDELPWGMLTRGYGIHDMDVDSFYRKEYTATSSDAGATPLGQQAAPGQHPRYFGAFVRKIARYVKDKGVVSLPFAVRSSTSLPAQIIGLNDRGIVREGYKADLVVFDYERLRDHATVLEPDQPNEGIEYVVTGGRVALAEGAITGELAGTIIRKR